jgi:hypothetical protein
MFADEAFFHEPPIADDLSCFDDIVSHLSGEGC